MKMSELDSKFKVRIRSRGEGGDDIIVEAPLPDDFGYTVGAAYSTPFDTMSINETMAKGFALAGVGQKPGAAMKKMFINAEPTEISFDLEFVAYYSARQEVVLPVLALSSMALPSRLSLEEGKAAVNGALAELKNKAGVGAEEGEESNVKLPSGVEEYGQALLDILNFVRGPDVVEVSFGDVYVMDNVFISSFGVRFSNKVDSEGFPMRATVSITLTPEDVPVVESLSEWYNIV